MLLLSMVRPYAAAKFAFSRRLVFFFEELEDLPESFLLDEELEEVLVEALDLTFSDELETVLVDELDFAFSDELETVLVDELDFAFSDELDTVFSEE